MCDDWILCAAAEQTISNLSLPNSALLGSQRARLHFISTAELHLLSVIKKLLFGEWNTVLLLTGLHPKLPLNFDFTSITYL